MSDDKKSEPSKVVRTAGAMFGGVIEASCLQPLDVTKTRMQLTGQRGINIHKSKMIQLDLTTKQER